MSARRFGARGFSLLELLVTATLTLSLTAVVAARLASSFADSSQAPEAADQTQRLRAAVDRLQYDLTMAGADAPGADADPAPRLSDLAPIRPSASSGLTLFYAAPGAPGAVLGEAFLSGSSALMLGTGGGCRRGPTDPAACGVAPGALVIVHDDAGRFDTLTVTGLSGGGGVAVADAFAASGRTYRPGSRVVPVVERTYVLEPSSTSRSSQLVFHEPGRSAAVPVVDHVVALDVVYYGDPHPPAIRRPPPAADASPDVSHASEADQKGTPNVPAIDGRAWASYGPRPPAWPVAGAPNTEPNTAAVDAVGYPPGESCTVRVDAATREQVPRLEVIGGDSGRTTLVPLSAASLADGPWCPDATDPHRFDADLLRVRAVAVTLTIEAASDQRRGPAGALFAHPGTARDLTRTLPDVVVHFEVAPRNLDATR